MKKKIKIFIISIIALLAYAVFSNVDAASANLNVSSTQVEVGTKVNVSVNINAAAWEIHVSGAASGNYSDTSNDGNNTSKTESLSFTPTSAGTYTISLSGNVTDGSSTDGKATNVSDSKTITVTAKQEQSKPSDNQNTNTNTDTNKNTNTNTNTQTKDPTFTNTNQTMYTTGSINLRSSWSTNSAATSVPAGTEVTVTGTSTEKVNGHVWYRVSYNGQTKYVASSLLTSTNPKKEEEQKEEEKSTNKALKELTVENHELSPAFSAETTKYSLTLKEGTDKLDIKATPADEKATVDIAGNGDFKVGNNMVKITVTAEDGTTRMYTITVSKTNEDGIVDMLKLSKLQIAKGTLEPSFDPEVTNYILTVEDPSTVKAEDIVAVAEDSDVEVTIAENTTSDNGEKVITIMLENDDGSKTGVYQITVKKPTVTPISNMIENGKDNKIYYILGGIMAILVVLIVIILVILKKTANKEEPRDIDSEDELDDDYDYSLKSAIDKVNNNSEDNEEEYDEMVQNSNVRSQILNSDYNVFKDSSNELGDDEEENPDLKNKKRGKHF